MKSKLKLEKIIVNLTYFNIIFNSVAVLLLYQKHRPAIINRVTSQLFPLDCCGWLGGDVVTDAVDTTDLVDDLIGDLRHEVVGQMGPVGSHGIGRGHGTQGHGMLVGTLVAHHADAADGGEEDGTSPPGLQKNSISI